MTKSRLTIVIVNWNSRSDLVACLRSLEEHPPSIAWDAIVVDNASQDGSAEAVPVAAPWAQLIANERNRGLAAAINQGLASASGEWLLVCNADILFRADAIDALLACMERHERAAFVIPKLLNPDGTIQPAAGDLPTFRECLQGRRLSSNARQGDKRGFWWDGWTHDEEVQVGHGAEACYLVRLRAVEAFGALDEGFFLDWEGIDWSARAVEAGWEIWFCPAAPVIHVGGVSVTRAGALWVSATHRGVYRYLRKHHGRRALVAMPVLAVRAALKAALLRVGGLPHRPRRARPARG